MTHHSIWYISPHQWPIVAFLVFIALGAPHALLRGLQRTREAEQRYRDYVRTHPYDPDSPTAQRWRDEARRWREEQGLPEIRYWNHD